MHGRVVDSGEAQALSLAGAELLYYRHWLSAQEAETCLHQLIEATPWRQESVTLFGKSHLQPRLVAWFGDPGAVYSYSGTSFQPLPWTALLLSLRERVAASTGCAYNSVLLNYYRDGRDAMGLHADDEPELGPQPAIASLSLGATRKLYFKHRRGQEPGYDLLLPSGSLLLMRGATQQNWKHGIRRTARPCGERVNLTFRHILPR